MKTSEPSSRPSGKWNIARDKRDNTEIFAVLVSVFLSFRSEEELIGWAKKQSVVGAFEPFLELLGSQLIMHLQNEATPLSLVLRAQLYLERMVEEIISKKFRHSEVILKNRSFTAAHKVDIVRARNLLDATAHNDIALINSLRNKFAHDLAFNIGAFDMSRFSYCGGMNRVYEKFRGAEVKETINTYLFKNVVLFLLMRLTARHEYLGDLKSSNKV